MNTTATVVSGRSSDPGITARLLGDLDVEDLRHEAGRLGASLCLVAAYGGALGLRQGVASVVAHAVGVPLGFVAVMVLGVPALAIVLGLFDAPIGPRALVVATSRATARSAVVLAGLAPAAALYVVTSGSVAGAVVPAACGLVAGAAAGLVTFVRDVGRSVEHSDDARRLAVVTTLIVFAGFAMLLAGRTWLASLPLFGGAS